MKKINFFVNYFKYIFIFTFACVGYFNQNSTLMSGILQYYIDYIKIIRADFNSEAATLGRPTFPMWGYGFLLLITQNKYLIFFIQSFFSFVVVLISISYVDKKWSLSNAGKSLLRGMILISFSWMAIHHTLSPYSLSISLTMLSVLFFSKSLERSKYKFQFVVFTGISAACAGLVLNLRSDYLYFFMLIPFIYLYILQSTSMVWMRVTIWYGIILLMMTPWMIYTNQTVGKILLTSTNSGHVFFIGLGQLPGNKWGIKGLDGDPRMHEELKIAGLKEDSLIYESDRFLKSKFLSLVFEDKKEYLKKVLYAASMSITSGIYVPEFYMLRGACKVETSTAIQIIDYISIIYPLLCETRKKDIRSIQYHGLRIACRKPVMFSHKSLLESNKVEPIDDRVLKLNQKYFEDCLIHNNELVLDIIKKYKRGYPESWSAKYKTILCYHRVKIWELNIIDEDYSN